MNAGPVPEPSPRIKERYVVPEADSRGIAALHIICVSIEAERADYGDPVEETW